MMQDSSGVGNGGDRHHDAFTTWRPGAGIRSGLALSSLDVVREVSSLIP